MIFAISDEQAREVAREIAKDVKNFVSLHQEEYKIFVENLKKN